MILSFCMLVGCGTTSSIDTKPVETTEKIVLSEVTHSIFYAPLYVALTKNYFKDEGLEIELVNGNGSNNVMTAIVSGNATIGLAGPETAVYTALQSGNSASPKAFGGLTACDGSFLIGREEDEDFSIESLRGKTIIAGRRGGMPAMTLEYALKQQGLIAGVDYTLNLDYDFGMVATVFESGIGDYCTMFEPVASAYQNANKGYIVESIGRLGGAVPYTAFIANQDYLTTHKASAERFLKAVYRGYLYLMNANISDVANALQPQFSSTSKENIEAAITNYKNLNAFASTPVISSVDYDRLCAIITNAGELRENVDFNKVVDNSIAEKVVAYFKVA